MWAPLLTPAICRWNFVRLFSMHVCSYSTFTLNYRNIESSEPLSDLSFSSTVHITELGEKNENAFWRQQRFFIRYMKMSAVQKVRFNLTDSVFHKCISHPSFFVKKESQDVAISRWLMMMPISNVHATSYIRDDMSEFNQHWYCDRFTQVLHG